MTAHKAAIGVGVRVDAWAVCPDHMTLDEFIELMGRLGNTVQHVDTENRKVRIMRETIDLEGNPEHG